MKSHGLAVLVLWLSGCGGFGAPSLFGDEHLRSERRNVLERRASEAQIERLKNEVRRLESDLRQAELFLIAAESRLAGAHTKAEAVRMAAEARNLLEVLSKQAPWWDEEIALARQKLAESDEHLKSAHVGAAILLASHATRIAAAIEEELETVRRAKNVRRVRVQRANLRSGPSTKSEVIGVIRRGHPVFQEKTKRDWVLVRTPSGRVGWVNGTLLESFPASPSR